VRQQAAASVVLEEGTGEDEDIVGAQWRQQLHNMQEQCQVVQGMEAGGRGGGGRREGGRFNMATMTLWQLHA
jgi:hypothetical protein